MCGIAGIWHRGKEKAVEEGVLDRMSVVMKHRGPDDAGSYRDQNIGLTHRRLAVIDLSKRGRQPMSTEDGRHTIVCNGEIYNYQELKRKYCQGIHFASESDTEVLLNVMARRGIEALGEVRGMFAFAWWDKEKGKLVIACGPLGKKPLYFAERGEVFIFASEMKAMLEHPLIKADIDRPAAAKYFLYEYVPAPATGYDGVCQLMMGHYAEVTCASVGIKQWWRPRFEPKVEAKTEQIVSEFDERLSNAVKRRTVADVPVGILLSGGIDSTTIAWYLKQLGVDDLHSFSVAFEEDTYDESGYARLAAKSLGTKHHEVSFGLSDWQKSLSEIVNKMDIPFADASLLPTYAVSKIAKQNVTVVLDGDGSDELLGGYGTFQAARAARGLKFIPRSLGRWAEKGASLLPTNYNYFSWDFKLKSFVRGLGYELPRQNQVWLGSFNEAGLKKLLTKQWRGYIEELFMDVDVLREEAVKLDVIDAVSFLTMVHYLHGDILVKLDRASMFVGLEARTPFLDVDLAEYAMRLPTRFKRDKYILRKLMKGRIPDKIINRGKQGFALPIGKWLRGPLYSWAKQVLDEEKIREGGILEPAEVARLLEAHRRGKADLRKQLWTLLMWQLWYDRWIENRKDWNI